MWEETVQKYLPAGEFYDDNSTKIHYIKKGKGSETVVFISGSGTTSPYADMYYLQKELLNWSTNSKQIWAIQKTILFIKNNLIGS